MKTLIILGRRYRIVKERSNESSIQLEGNKIIIAGENSASKLLKEFLKNLLYSQLTEIYDQMRKEGRVEVFGDLDFEIVDKIDNRRGRIAKLKGNKILVKLSTIGLPKSALKYVIAHEIAHICVKRHTKRFWNTVKLIYPNYEEGLRIFKKYEKTLKSSIL